MSAVTLPSIPIKPAGLLKITLYAAAAMLWLGPVLGHLSEWYIGWPGDPQQFMWYLGWFWHALAAGENPFFTRQLNAPIGQSLMWNTSVLAESALVGWSMHWLPGAAVYNLLWIANWLCACLLGDALLRDLGVRRWLAAAGGLLYGMMPYFTSQTLFHLHLWLTSVPLGLTLVLLRGIRRRPRHPWRYGIFIGALAALQMYTALEVAATFALVAAIAALFTLITLQSRVRDVFPVSGRLVLSAIWTTAILALPGLVALMHGPSRPAGKLLPADAYVNDLFTFFVPTPVYALHTAWSTALSLTYTGNFWENDGYLGPAALLWIALAAIRLWRLPCARAALCTFLIVTLLSMGPTLHFAGRVTPLRLPWSLLERVPFLESALPSRLMLYADGIAIALGVFALEVHLRKSRRRTPAHLLSFATLALVAATWWPVTPYYHSATPDAARALTEPGPVRNSVAGRITFVLSADTPDVMQAMADGGYRMAMVNEYGYTANSPTRREAMAQLRWSLLNGRLPESELKARVIRAISILQPEYLMYYPVQDGERLPPAATHVLASLFGPPVAVSHGVQVWSVRPSARP